MKRIIQNLLHPFGYQIQDLRKFGREPGRDLQILLQSVPAPVCFDVGAHRGETIQNMLVWFPSATIYAFEPDPDNFAMLQKTSGQQHKTRLFQLGLGDTPCVTKLLKTSFSMGNSILPAATTLKSEAHKQIGEVEITVTTLDLFCQQEEIKTIDLLKTDCQGFDLRVLHGAAKMLSERRIGVIQCEGFFYPEYEGQGWFYEILEFLTGQGYAPVSFGEPMRNANLEILWMDVIFKRRNDSVQPQMDTDEHR